MKLVKLIGSFFVFILCLSCLYKQKISERALQKIINSKTKYDLVGFANHFNIDKTDLKIESDEYLIGKELMEGKNNIEIRKFPKNQSSYFIFYFIGDLKYFYKFDIIEFVNNEDKDWVIPTNPK